MFIISYTTLAYTEIHPLLHRTKSFLPDRSFHFALDGCRYAPWTTNTEFPQSTILSPTLFLTFENIFFSATQISILSFLIIVLLNPHINFHVQSRDLFQFGRLVCISTDFRFSLLLYNFDDLRTFAVSICKTGSYSFLTYYMLNVL